MSYNVKNYTEQGGEKTVIGGEIVIDGKITVADGGEVAGITGVAGAATATALGGIKAAASAAGDTVEVKIDATSSKLYVPTYPVTATAETAGLIKAGAKGEGDTVEAKIGADGKLYVPTYPVVPEIPIAAKQIDSEATTVAGLVTDFNALLAKLKVAGLMTAE